MLPTTYAKYICWGIRIQTHAWCNRNTSMRVIKPATSEMVLETYMYFTTPIYDGNWVWRLLSKCYSKKKLHKTWFKKIKKKRFLLLNSVSSSFNARGSSTYYGKHRDGWPPVYRRLSIKIKYKTIFEFNWYLNGLWRLARVGNGEKGQNHTIGFCVHNILSFSLSSFYILNEATSLQGMHDDYTSTLNHNVKIL